MTEKIEHYQINGKYRVCFEQSAVKGQLGFKVEANADLLSEASEDAARLLKFAQTYAPALPVPTAKGE